MCLLIGEKVNCVNVLFVLSWLVEIMGKDDMVIVYFFGYGIEKLDYYLMFYGYNLENLEGIVIRGEIFMECLRVIKIKKLLVLLDCCYVGG